MKKNTGTLKLMGELAKRKNLERKGMAFVPRM